MQKGYLKYVRLLIVIAIVGAFVWFLVLSPMITFRNNEKTLKDAAVRYFELNSEQLPTGERVKTLSLNTLYKKSYLKDDFKAPYSNDICSLDNSWVKVRRENGVYTYYVYLDCGLLKSKVDHTGPQIKLNGKEEMTLNVGEEFKDPGIKSVVDDKDGKMDKENVTVKGEVDSKKVGTYEITYTALDNLNNKNTVTRIVKVIREIGGVVKNDLGKATNYVGEPENNYVRLSNMYFRIFGLTKEGDVILVADEDVANVNFTKIDKWLDEVYLTHMTDDAKKLLVKHKFCDMKVTDDKLDATECTNYTKERYAYIPSNVEVNLAEPEKALDGNFMKTFTMSWIATRKNDKEAYVVRDVFFADAAGQKFYLDKASYNYGVRPMIVVKGDALIVSGDGTQEKPYSFGETKKAKGGDLLNTRYPGEFIETNGFLWRILEVEKDGTIKVIAEETLGNLKERPQVSSYDGYDTLKYNPKDKDGVAYFINNKSSEYIDVSIFSTHEIEIPVYKKSITYGEVKEYKKYKVKLSAPSMYDMFSAQPNMNSNNSYSYWLCDTAPGPGRIGAVVTDIGVPVNDEIPQYYKYGVRVVGFLKKGTVVTSGSGTYSSPYKLK